MTVISPSPKTFKHKLIIQILTDTV